MRWEYNVVNMAIQENELNIDPQGFFKTSDKDASKLLNHEC